MAHLGLVAHAGVDEDLRETTFDDWRKQVSNNYTRLRGNHDNVYVVGFSEGALLAIDLATTHDVSGVLALSTFLGPTRLRQAKFAFYLRRLLKRTTLPHRVRTTLSRTHHKLRWVRRLPLRLADALLRDARRISSRFGTLTCPVLFLHSIDDRVSSYTLLSTMIRMNSNVSSLVVTFFKLDHYLQFDVAPSAIVDLAEEVFELEQPSSEALSGESLLSERLKSRSDEARHWADVLFRMIVGFYTIMGGLLYFSLSDVLDDKPNAPYYVVAYWRFRVSCG